MQNSTIRPRERDSVIQALRAGVAPRMGLQHIQVGRAREVEEFVKDIERIAQGGAAIRFVIGDYGSGKTFMLNLVRTIANEKGMVTLNADVSPDRRLHASNGQARSLYSELTRNAATRSKPEGGAIPSIVERFATQAIIEAESREQDPASIIKENLAHLQELTGGYDFASVIARYWEAYETDDEELKANAIRWLRAEFSTRTDARRALGVRTIIEDTNFYDQLKILALFVRQAGYQGLLVCLDEMVNIYRLSSGQARQSNYEQLLRILNDSLQGSAQYIGFLLGGTPEFLLDSRRGLYSYQALQTRLAENRFAQNGYIDLSGPVIRLPKLTPEEMFVLLSKIRTIMQPDPSAQLPDQALEDFMAHCNAQIGASYFQTPRNTIRTFVQLLSILEQNQDADWTQMVRSASIEHDPQDPGNGGASAAPQANEEGNNDDLAKFRI